MGGHARHRTLLRAAAIAAAVAAWAVPAAPSAGDLGVQLQSVQGKADSLNKSIASDNAVIQSFQGKISDLQVRLNGLETSLAIQQSILQRDKRQLREARAHLLRLRVALANDRRILAQQAVAAYEDPQPDIVSVVFAAKGFADLLERVDRVKAVGKQNAKVVEAVRTARTSVHKETRRLSVLSARQERVTAAVLVQRNQVDGIRLVLVRRQSVFVRSKDQKSSKLAVLQRQQAELSKKIQAQQSAAAAAVGSGFAFTGVVPTIGSFTAHGGTYGFFQAAGTNYSVGEEPALAAHLDALGIALHLHLIGLSGYRTPQHSVEVGGFANDPHTQGRASDTPGVEGVSEATLNRFGLTRPFGGAAEADHIQLLGG
jgi:peptidoglycan hydrolase CwlO-like protein